LVFSALEWLANLCSPIPPGASRWCANYGHYSISRVKRRMEGTDDAVPSIIESQGDEKTFRRNWARLIHPYFRLIVPSQVLMQVSFLSSSLNHRDVTHLDSV
jgi:hypothetical protein